MKILITELQYIKLLKPILEDTDDVGLDTMTDREKDLIFKNEIEPEFRYLKSLAARYYKDIDTRNELVQDTIIKSYKYLNQYKPGTNPRAWLSTILKNTFLNDYKKKSNERNSFSLDAIQGDTFMPDDDVNKEPSEFIYDNPDYGYSDVILNALNKLPENFKDIYIMANVDDYSGEEIANKYNIPVGTVKSRLSRIKKFLTKELSKTSLSHDKIKFGKKIKKSGEDDEFGVPTIEKPTTYYPPIIRKPSVKIEKPIISVPTERPVIKVPTEKPIEKKIRVKVEKPKIKPSVKIEKPVTKVPTEKPIEKTRTYLVKMTIDGVNYDKSFNDKNEAIKYREELEKLKDKTKSATPIIRRERPYTNLNDNVSFDGTSYVVRMMIRGKKYTKNFDNIESALDYQNELTKLKYQNQKNTIRFNGNSYDVFMTIRGKRYFKRFKNEEDAIKYQQELMKIKNNPSEEEPVNMNLQENINRIKNIMGLHES